MKYNMKAYVITIMSHQGSLETSWRCIESGKKHGLDIERFEAITPSDNPLLLLEQEGISDLGFEEKYSRNLNCISAFLSHYSLWKKCIELDEEVIIFEHDAVLTDPIPNAPYTYVCNFGKPSYGQWNTPQTLGLNPLTSKKYFPGAHAYGVKPEGAKKLVYEATSSGKPTDVYLHSDTFPWLQEYYPWPAEARDNFTTIQNINGCYAKHNFDKDYEISDV
tara:strand:- start:221 stop:880 length:660 start_codon:yes stop_codon:yes gene_type:complete